MKSSALIVEDDVGIRDTLQMLFEEEGVEVKVAGNGREALDLLLGSKDSPCVVLLDLMMPVLTGQEFLKELHEKHPDLAAQTQVIVITAAPLSGEEQRSLKPFVKGFVRKPFKLDEVVEMIHQYCG